MLFFIKKGKFRGLFVENIVTVSPPNSVSQVLKGLYTCPQVQMPECRHFVLSYSCVRFYQALNLLRLERGEASAMYYRGQWLTCSVSNPATLMSMIS